MKNIKLIALAVLLSQSLFSQYLDQEGWSSNNFDDITMIYPDKNYLNFTLDNTSFDGGTCNNGKQFYISKKANLLAYEMQLKILTEAFFNHKKIRIYWTGENKQSGCFGKVDRIIVKD